MSGKEIQEEQKRRAGEKKWKKEDHENEQKTFRKGIKK